MSNKKQILDIYFQTNINYEIRYEKLNGKEHVVVPVTMMVEGVHSGSLGPTMYSADELCRYPESWDGIPVTINHPQANGMYVSANSPDILEGWAVGQVFNTREDNGSLKAEAWLRIEDLERVSEGTLDRIKNTEIMEVSLGIISDRDAVQGNWNGENYIAIARNHRPNHLALLPDQVGACSIEDGCGLRVNKKGGTNVEVLVNDANQAQVLKELNKKGFSINNMGYRELDDKIRQAVYSLDGSGLDNYLEEVYDNYVIYKQHNNRVEPRVSKLVKQSFEVNAADNVKLVGEAVHVKREVNYTVVPTVNTEGRVKTQRGDKITVMSEKCTDCVKKLVDGLIENKNTAWSDTDREVLSAMSEETLEKMTPQLPKEVTPIVNAEASTKISREDILAVLREKPLTQEEFAAFAPAEVTSQMNANKANMVSEILANSDVWEEEELASKEVGELTKLHKLATKGATYAAAGGLGGNTQFSNNSSQVVMLPPEATAVSK